MSKLMEEKAGLITAAGSGIGRASALAFAKEGAKVMVSDVSTEAGEETVRLINDAGGVARFFKCDVSNEEEVRELVHATVDAFGQLDWAHNNAGISSETISLVESSSEDWARTLNVNLNGMYYALKYEIEQMIKTGGGAIVNTASMSGLAGRARLAPYSASKWGVNSLTKTAAIEYGNQGIRVNSICPGMTLTPGVESWAKGAPDLYENVLSTIPLGRMGTSEEQANSAVFLCSEKASFITGVNLVVDGGRSAQ